MADVIKLNIGGVDYDIVDASVPSWAKQSTKPTYTANEVGALPASTHIPVDPVQSDWEESNSTSLAFIQHKPEVPKVVYGKKTSSGFLQGILEQGGTWSYILTPVTPEKKVHYIDVNTYQTYIWNGTSYVRLDQEAFDGPTEQKTVINISWDQNNVLSFSYADDNTSITSADVLALLQEEGNDIIFKKEDYYYILQYKTSSSWWYQCFEGDASTFHYFSLDNNSGNLVLDERGDREFAPLNSPGFTGTPTAPTATSGTSTTQIATTAFVQSAINALPTPMVFQGTIGTGGTSTTVPSTPTEGDTYKIISGGESLTFSGITEPIKAGDTVVYKNSTIGWILIPSGDEPSGTVTSVGISVPTGLTVTTSPNENNPITDSGTFNITYDNGYSIPTTAKQGNWDTAYTNTHTHSNKSVLDGISSDKVSHWDTAYTNNHTHSNKTILDSISQEKVNSWDGKLSSVQIYHSSKVGQNGIVAIEDPLFIVTVTRSGSVYSINSTYNAIVNAGLSVGRTPVLSYDSNLFWLSQYVSGSYVSFSNIQDNIQQSFYIFYDDSIEYKITSIDSAPSSGSSNLVTSGGVYTALAGKQDAIEIIDLT